MQNRIIKKIKTIDDLLKMNSCEGFNEEFLELDIRLKHLYPYDTKNVIKVLNENKFLATNMTLHLKNCGITSNHLYFYDVKYFNLVVELTKFIQNKNSPAILNIVLSGNNIGDEGIRHFIEAIKNSHCSYLSLNLVNNQIGPKGAEYLAAMIKNNDYPKKLKIHLDHNHIGDSGALEIIKGLKNTNPCNQLMLTFTHNQISSNVYASLEDALNQSSGLFTDYRQQSVTQNSSFLFSSKPKVDESIDNYIKIPKSFFSI